MKKLFYIIAFSLIFAPIAAQAEQVVIIDDNGIVKQQIYTYPMNSQVVTTQSVYTQPQQVIVQQPVQQDVVVVRETPRHRNYYYDSAATALLAGFTGVVIGEAIFGHHHSKPSHHGGHNPKPHGGSPHKGGHRR